ncbi:hypothetical protein RRSWK_04596 [Rhodopirellula sp. SWK7]|nr:hypothetical protein RRSWK_04596 [Rhodopirellula sp. SWK7]
MRSDDCEELASYSSWRVGMLVCVRFVWARVDLSKALCIGD